NGIRGRPLDWSSDGKFLVYLDGRGGLWALRLDGDGTPIKIADMEGGLARARVSPDRRWIAYSTGPGDASNVWVQPFLSSGTKIQISPDGGSDPSWRADGKELYYFRPDGALMAVPIQAAEAFRAGVPHLLFRVDPRGWSTHQHAYSA